MRLLACTIYFRKGSGTVTAIDLGNRSIEAFLWLDARDAYGARPRPWMKAVGQCQI
jgi:hypothetical protein